ncbi:Exosome complex component MTR3 [Acipenser ruthenus]|uniref:Exosome complex component MTR3 n=1 Tax=Acipenser ruthenus TaxID=7906 RepID=A0A444UL49_ACIRT|nr:Exosome complex component MTR3 [Acipenser ruthenus]
MPVDTKRVRGPEKSQSPWLFVQPTRVPKTRESERRADSRRRGQVDARPMFARCGLVSQTGNTKLICSVYGPRQTERKDELDMKASRLDCSGCVRVFLYLHRSVTIQVCEDEKVSTVWSLISEKLNIPVNQPGLLYKGKALADEHRLSHDSIAPDSKLNSS